MLPPLQTERCECPQCESPVATTNVFCRYDFEALRPTRTVAIFCPHCDVFYERSFELSGFQWTPTGNPTLINSAKRLAGLRKKVEQLSRIQLAQSA